MTAEQVLSWWSFIFLGVVVYVVGEWVKQTVRDRFQASSWQRRLFDRTVLAHAPLVATCIALLPGFPIPPELPQTVLSFAIFGFVAGVFAAWSYKLVKRILGKDRDTKSSTAEAEAEGEA